MTEPSPKLIIAFEKKSLPLHLCHAIITKSLQAIKDHDAFTIALSGGSLTAFLSELESVFDDSDEAANSGMSFDEMTSKWHALLADERCVPTTDDDSNLKSLREDVFNSNAVSAIPTTQIYGINEALLDKPVDEIARDYEATLQDVLQTKSNGMLDCAVLGFGPDGHTCSLFPDHVLLRETTKLVAGIDDSPKPPAKRITLTLKVLNEMTHHVIVCGAGPSKGPVLREVFLSLEPSADENYKVPRGAVYKVTREDPPPYPCSMVLPKTPDGNNTLTWIVDAEAMDQAKSAPSPY